MNTDKLFRFDEQVHFVSFIKPNRIHLRLSVVVKDEQ